MINRRALMAAIAVIALLQSTPTAYAADPVEVEIIGLAHWPVRNALEPIREMLEGFGSQIIVTEYDADTQEGKDKMSDAGQRGHVPVLILIDGEYQFTREDGSKIEFLNFPADAENPANLNGAWSVGDVEYVVTLAVGG